MTDLPEDFSNYPVSIAEAKASNNPQGAGEWTPRDALIAALRAIDSGEINPQSVIVVSCFDDGNNATVMHYFNAIPNTMYGVGMMNAGIKDFFA